MDDEDTQTQDMNAGDEANSPEVTENDVAPSETPQTDVSGDESSDAGSATVMLNLEQLIKTHLATIARRREELKKYREMLASTLANDEEFRDLEQKAKDAAKEKSKRKTELMSSTEVKQVQSKVTEITSEVKEMSEALSDYASEYQRISGSNEIETDDGEVHEIIYIAKLVKKSSRRAK